ncbi:COG4315 family predicted lipoprotein [Celeribacter naphthalenivorans]|uniref:hypothetical protein n=1 Tax=Celeribacter naphthalenivorans TaxID=1614694 RepID=UPI001CFACA9B|nr:hypothetical protein [Celeribacter naphthalenivorans]
MTGKLGEAGMDLTSGYALISRKNGTEQVAYRGQLLYLLIKAENPSVMTGEGLNDVWHITRP